jgi:hypothetical protein
MPAPQSTCWPQCPASRASSCSSRPAPSRVIAVWIASSTASMPSPRPARAQRAGGQRAQPLYLGGELDPELGEEPLFLPLPRGPGFG